MNATLEQIINNAIPAIVWGVVSCGIFEWLKVKYINSPPIIKLSSIKIVKVLEFSFKYLLSFGIIVFLMYFKKTKTENDLYIFCFICALTVYNILINKISDIYIMFTRLTNKTASDFIVIDDAFGRNNSNIKALDNRLSRVEIHVFP